MYQVFEVPNDAANLPEQLGTKRKFWFKNGDGEDVLFKQGRPGTGENWAEKAVCSLSSLIGLPHAHYELGRYGNMDGVLSPSFVSEGDRLVHGNELLGKFVSGYDTTLGYHQKQHTLSRVMATLRPRAIVLPDHECAQYLEICQDVFVGYLMLDAWVGNGDRHHENWGLMVRKDGTITIAPTYDHASSLGRSESDEKRKARLATKDYNFSVENFVTRARSALYRSTADDRPMSTLDAFIEAASIRPQAAQFWVNRLDAIGDDEVERIFSMIPRPIITDVAAEFAMKILEKNKQRLLKTRREPK